jgi:integrase
MPRQVRDSALETRTARSRLKPKHTPYWRLIQSGLHLGYRRRQSGPGAWIRRRWSDGKYAVENLRTPDGKLIIADDYEDADGTSVLSFAQAQKLAAVERTAARTKARTVADALDAYFQFLKNDGRTAHSVYDAERRAQAFIRPELGPVKLSTLTTERLRQWRDGLAVSAPRLRTRAGEEQKLGALAATDDARRKRRASTNRTWTILVAALNFAFRQGQVDSDSPWRRVQPFRSVDKPRSRYLSLDECTRLINAADPDFRPLVQGALLTGMRYGELCALTVADFISDAGCLLIRRSKSGKARNVTLTDEGIALFGRLVAGRAAHEFVFRHSDGSGWKASQQARPMIEANARARITPPISIHGLRHSWCSHAVIGGTPLLIVAQHLGHADTRMVEKVYGHLAKSFVSDAIRAGAPRFESIESDSVVPIAAGRTRKRQ